MQPKRSMQPHRNTTLEDRSTFPRVSIVVGSNAAVHVFCFEVKENICFFSQFPEKYYIPRYIRDRSTWEYYLSSANSATNSNVKLIVPPAMNPATKRPIYTSVAFVASNINDQQPYFQHILYANEKTSIVIVFFLCVWALIRKTVKWSDFVHGSTSWGNIITANVFFRPNPSPINVKKITPTKPPTYNDESIHFTSLRVIGGTCSGVAFVWNVLPVAMNQAIDKPCMKFSKLAVLEEKMW